MVGVPVVGAYLLSGAVVYWGTKPYEASTWGNSFSEGYVHLLGLSAAWALIGGGLWFVIFWIATSIERSTHGNRKERKRAAAGAQEQRDAELREAQAEATRLREEKERIDLEKEALERSQRDADDAANALRADFDQEIWKQVRMELVNTDDGGSNTFRFNYDGDLGPGEQIALSVSIDLIDEDGRIVGGRGWRVGTMFLPNRLETVETVHHVPPEAVTFKTYGGTIHDFVSPYRVRP